MERKRKKKNERANGPGKKTTKKRGTTRVFSQKEGPVGFQRGGKDNRLSKRRKRIIKQTRETLQRENAERRCTMTAPQERKRCGGGGVGIKNQGGFGTKR